MGRLVARGKYIYDGAQKFFARGVSYGPFSTNSRGEQYPEPERAAADFALMRELGANLVRTYVLPPAWLLELAAKHEMRLMVGISWPSHIAFLDSSEMVRDIRNTIRDGVRRMSQFADVIFAYSLGNEVRSDIVRWHGARAVCRFLAELRDIGKQTDPDGLFTYSNYPSTEYLDLNFLDVVSFNVYLHDEANFRRYLTHLLAATRDRPLVLSETGMDTIREGEAHQAELLAWQSRAAFELGLSGSVVFAFTDEWHRGGAEITDWAFGLVTRERKPKLAFGAVAEVFRGELPPPLKMMPKASVIVPAFNAAGTIARCLESLNHLNYPDYEIIVVDDGSTDATAQIAEHSGIRTLRLAHRGLGAARNAGFAAASGGVVAYLDADAEADRDWLYHLVEALTRQDGAAAGGQNFAPDGSSTIAAAIAAAPGEPREVRAGADELAQVCGCSMALDKTRFESDAPFDPAFETAGDDVDFSWRLREAGMRLAYAPGAIVMHERRRTVGAYLRQQLGYGRAEGLLYRKYPKRAGGDEIVYGGAGWLASWFGVGPRIYYGTFGRGLFQSVYPGSILPLAAQVPLSFEWIAVAIVLTLVGLCNPVFATYAILGCIAISISVLCAVAAAMVTPREAMRGGVRSRLVLALLWLMGPLVRSWGRLVAKSIYRPDSAGAPSWATPSFSGRVVFSPPPGSYNPPPDTMVERMRAALVGRGLAVAKGDAYDVYDLQILVPPGLVRVPLLLLERNEQTFVGWHTRLASLRIAIVYAFVFAICITLPLLLGAALAAVSIVVAGGTALYRARHLSAVIAAAAADAASEFSLALQLAPPETH